MWTDPCPSIQPSIQREPFNRSHTMSVLQRCNKYFGGPLILSLFFHLQQIMRKRNVCTRVQGVHHKELNQLDIDEDNDGFFLVITFENVLVFIWVGVWLCACLVGFICHVIYTYNHLVKELGGRLLVSKDHGKPNEGEWNGWLSFLRSSCSRKRVVFPFWTSIELKAGKKSFEIISNHDHKW